MRVSIGELRNMRTWKSTTERLSRAVSAIWLSHAPAQLPQACHPSPRGATYRWEFLVSLSVPADFLGLAPVP